MTSRSAIRSRSAASWRRYLVTSSAPMTAAHSPASTAIFIHPVESVNSMTTLATTASAISAAIIAVATLSVASPSPVAVGRSSRGVASAPSSHCSTCPDSATSGCCPFRSTSKSSG